MEISTIDTQVYFILIIFFLKKPLFDLMSLENSDVINKNFNHWL